MYLDKAFIIHQIIRQGFKSKIKILVERKLKARKLAHAYCVHRTPAPASRARWPLADCQNAGKLGQARFLLATTLKPSTAVFKNRNRAAITKCCRLCFKFQLKNIIDYYVLNGFKTAHS